MTNRTHLLRIMAMILSIITLMTAVSFPASAAEVSTVYIEDTFEQYGITNGNVTDKSISADFAGSTNYAIVGDGALAGNRSMLVNDHVDFRWWARSITAEVLTLSYKIHVPAGSAMTFTTCMTLDGDASTSNEGLGGAVDGEGVPEGGLPEVGQGEGGDPSSVHGGKEVADHVGVSRVVHVTVEVQIAVHDGAISHSLHLGGGRNADAAGKQTLVGKLAVGEVPAEVGGADHLLLIDINERPVGHRQRHLLLTAVDGKATDEVVALVVDAPRPNFDLLVGADGGKDLHHHAGEEKALAVDVVQIRQIHAVLPTLDIGGLLHVDEERRGAHHAVPVGVVPFGFVVGGIVHGLLQFVVSFS